MARDLPVLRLAIALTQVLPPPSPPCDYPHALYVYIQTEHVIDGVSLLERLYSLGFTHDATLKNM